MESPPSAPANRGHHRIAAGATGPGAGWRRKGRLPVPPSRKPHPRGLRNGLGTGLAVVVMIVLAPLGRAGEGVFATVVSGTPEVRSTGSDRWRTVGPGTELFYEDDVRAPPRASVRLLIPSGAQLTFPGNTWIRSHNPAASAPVPTPDGRPIVEVLRGLLLFFSRQGPRSLEFHGPGCVAASEGTEFTFGVDERDNTSTIAVYDGKVTLVGESDPGPLGLGSGEIATSRPGSPPRKEASRWEPGDFTRIQWALHYPCILDPGDLGWTAAPDAELIPSYTAFRAGNLPRALASYPPSRRPATPAESLFLAALLLSAGNVEEAEQVLSGVGEEPTWRRLAEAHRRLIAAVLRREGGPGADLPPAPRVTERLAASYWLQSRARLAEALEEAARARDAAPDSGFAWARCGELEFSFGHTRQASAAAARALELTPDLAPALALSGFAYAAENRIADAEKAFVSATRIDGTLGDAWLGLGLCRIRRGDLAEGRRFLLVAASSEPQRSLPRSYLAKALAEGRPWSAPPKAASIDHELTLARRLDPLDPTPWLYQSLHDREENRVNASLRALDLAADRSANRGLYRSDLLLDQDRAVTAANQALAFRDAGFGDLAVHAAGRAVSLDYANPAAHQFLAESYSSPDRSNLRSETPRVSEYLMANLLSPVGAGLLSASLSQQEYSRLFVRDGLGGFSETTYLDRGAWSQSAGARGTFGNSEFLAEGFYQTDPGRAANTDREQRGFEVQLEQQVGPRDTLYAQAFGSDQEAGDLRLLYDPDLADPDLRVVERLEPAVVAGWHRAWSPEHHTLLVSGWVEDLLSAHDFEPDRVGGTGPAGPATEAWYESDFELFTADLQHLWLPEDHTVVLGARWQAGSFDVHHVIRAVPGGVTHVNEHVRPDLDRSQVYAYDTWAPCEAIRLTAGLSYDALLYPVNHRYANATVGSSLDGGEDRRTQLSPKVGALWEFARRTWLRAAYTRSLGGVSFDQSYRLEPTQVAGFNQAFRSLIPDTLAGPTSAPGFETWGVGVESRLSTNTWVTASANHLASDAKRWLGFRSSRLRPPRQLPQELEYQERSLLLTLNQLVGRHWSFGLNYQLLEARLEEVAEAGVDPPADTPDQTLNHRLAISARFHDESGWFAGGEAVWLHQDDSGNLVLPSEDLWQLNVWTGWRFLRRRAELLVGILNLTDADYRLNPLGFESLPERERTFMTRLLVSF